MEPEPSGHGLLSHSRTPAAVGPRQYARMTDGTLLERSRAALPLSQLLTLSIYWLGIQVIWGGLNITIIPGRLDDMSRDTQGTMLAVIMVVGALAPIIVQPTVGVISDYTVTSGDAASRTS